MNTSIDNLFYEVLSDIKNEYINYGFFLERDFVWTVQKKSALLILENDLPYKVFNDYPIEQGKHRSKSVDLAIVMNTCHYKEILEGKSQAELVVEFKFEPSKMRKDICVHKLPVVFWSEVLEDIERVKRFVNQKRSKAAISIFVDEYGRYRNEDKYLVDKPSNWNDWGKYNTDVYNISALITEFRG